MSGRTTADGRRYRFFTDSGHGWLEVPRAEVVASGAKISTYSYYDPATGMAYLEEDCDALAFLKAAGLDRRSVPTDPVYSSMPRQLPAYDPADFMDTHVYMVRLAGTVSDDDYEEEDDYAHCRSCDRLLNLDKDEWHSDGNNTYCGPCWEWEVDHGYVTEVAA